MMRYILLALLAWFLYNLIFRFIIPVYRTSRKMKQQFREMQEQMQEKMRQQQGYAETPRSKPAAQKPASDYIDFEEIK